MLSRVADSLYWMSRFLERAEHTARVVDVQLNLVLEEATGVRTTQRWGRLIQSVGMDVPRTGIDDNFELTNLLTFDADNPYSILSCITAARENARQVRELISTEMWLQLNRLFLSVKQGDLLTVWNTQPHEFFRSVKEGAQLFQGITDDTLVRNEGWHFIQLGRYIERCRGIVSLLNNYADIFKTQPNQSHPLFDSYFERLGLLKSFTAFEAYCKVYNADLDSRTVAEFLLFNPEFPHAASFCASQIKVALDNIAEATTRNKTTKAHRLAGKLYSSLHFDQMDEVQNSGFSNYLVGIQSQCAQIHDAMYEVYITYPIQGALHPSLT